MEYPNLREGKDAPMDGTEILVRAPVGGDGKSDREILAEELECRGESYRAQNILAAPHGSLTEDTQVIRAALAAMARVRCAIPDGWRMVPEQPTDEMLEAAISPYRAGNTDEFNEILRRTITKYWTDALSAAPTLPIAKGDDR